MLIAGALAITTAPAQAEETSSAEAETIVVVPLTLIKVKDLDFGKIVPGTIDGIITLRPNGTILTTGGILVLSGTTQPAEFEGAGVGDQGMVIKLDRNFYDLTRDGGTETMRLRRLRAGTTPQTALTRNFTAMNNFSVDGAFAFSVGGQLLVAANQAPGIYSGEFEVTVEYN